MKKITLFSSILLFSGLLFIGCQKEDLSQSDTLTSEDTLVGNDFGNAQTLQTQTFLTVLEEIKKQAALNGINNEAQEKSLSCPTITISPSGSTFPKTVTLDFGSGCTTSSGATASGIITATVSGSIDKTGTTITVIMNNFIYNGYGVNGTYIATVVSAGVYSVSVQNGSVSKDAKKVTFAGTINITQVAGQSTTTNINDDVYDISVSLTGTDTSGKNFSVASSTPLRKTASCSWIVSGIVTITKQARPKTTLDFGSGACDNQATLTVGKTSSIITLP